MASQAGAMASQAQSQVSLSQSQQDAVTAPWRGTVNMILSTAGSGKTLTLTRRAVWIAKELVREGIPRARLLCVCFNKRAATEMFERIREELDSLNLHESVFVTTHGFSVLEKVTIEVRTFHALGFWILHTASPAECESIGIGTGRLMLRTGKELNAIAMEALKEAGEVTDYMSQRSANSFAGKMARNFSDQKRRTCDAECEAMFSKDGPMPSRSHAKENWKAFQLFQERMREQSAIDYSDMISKAVEMAAKNKSVQTRLQLRYSAVLVDEFQDMSPSNFVLCKFFVDGSKSLTLVGDDDQRIYSFRSSMTWICHERVASCFRKQLKIFRLPENRRCPGAVVKSANAVIRQNSQRYEKNITPVLSDGIPVRVVGCKSMQLQIQFVVQRIKALLPRAQKAGHQILVLFRINQMLEMFKKKLRAAGVKTSGIIAPPVAAEPLGPKTLAISALILMMSRTVDRDTFVWAATTVSPALDRNLITEICDEDEQAMRSDARESNEISEAGDGETEMDTPRQEKSYPAPFLDKLLSWFTQRRDAPGTSTNVPGIDSVRALLTFTDGLLNQMRSVSSMEDLVQRADAVLSSDHLDTHAAYPEELGSQQSEADVEEAKNAEKAGYSLLISAAQAIDQPSELEKLVTLQRSLSSPKGPSSIADDDAEDFSLLFSQDEKSRAVKRRKILGVRPQLAHNSGTGQGDVIKERLNGFAQELTDLLVSDKDISRPLRRGQSTAVLSTIHRAKGAQSAYVFLCGADKNNLPNGTAWLTEQGVGIDLQSPHVQEERRIFFVAMTRTQKEFTCTYSIPEMMAMGDAKEWQSPFVAEMLEGIREGGDANCVSEFLVENQAELQTVMTRLQDSKA